VANFEIASDAFSSFKVCTYSSCSSSSSSSKSYACTHSSGQKEQAAPAK
jgi:hypothetical protein